MSVTKRSVFLATSLMTFAACAFLGGDASAQELDVGESIVIDMSGRSGVVRSFDAGAGDYVVEAIAGTYSAWSAWRGSPTWCNRPNGACWTGWLTTFEIHTDIEGTILANPYIVNGLRTAYVSPTAALAASSPQDLCLSAPQELGLRIADYPYYDNQGGLSIRITRVNDFCASLDQCPDDPDKTEPGQCGCGVPDDDSDDDSVADCNDICPFDPNDDADGDGICGDVDNCPDNANGDQSDADGDGSGDTCDPWHDICGNASGVEVPLYDTNVFGVEDNDEGISDWISAGFGFYMYSGFGASGLRVFANGLSVHRYFTDAGDTAVNAALPHGDDDLRNVIAPFWADLENVTVCMLEGPGMLTLQWTGNEKASGASVEFQSNLQSSGVITFSYGPNHEAGASSTASIGIEGYYPTDGMSLGFHDPGATDPGTGHILTPNNPWVPSYYDHTVF